MPIDPSELRINRDLSITLSRQLYQQLRQQILSGKLLYQERLPSTRSLAMALSLSRQVIVDSYTALTDEGLIVGLGKGGTRVIFRAEGQRQPTAVSLSGKLSCRGADIAKSRRYATGDEERLVLSPSQPDPTLFPNTAWQRLYKLAWESASNWYQYDAGLPLLKRQLINFLKIYRGIEVSPECLLITTGTQASLSLLMRVLADAGDVVGVEHPGWGGARAAAKQAELAVHNLRVDAEGAIIPDAHVTAPQAVIITPTMQFPRGVVMSAARRLAWVEYARQNQMWIIEDDYAAEYCAGQHPPLSLLADFHHQQIIHVGTFAKLLHPGMRVGWMVVPQSVADDIRSALYTIGLQPSYVIQQQLALFMQYGYFAQHLSHTRAIYNMRREACLAWLQSHENKYWQVQPSQGGMNHYLSLSAELVSAHGDAKALAHTLQDAGFGVDLFEQQRQVSLLLGHAKVSNDALCPELERLHHMLTAPFA